MKTYITQKKKLNTFTAVVIFAVAAVLILTAGLISYKKAFAYGEYDYFTGYSQGMTPEQLNNSILNSGISLDSPVMTVLTAETGGGASSWSNVAGRFTYDEESLPERLRVQSKGNVYWAKVDYQNSGGYDFYLSELAVNNYDAAVKITALTEREITKHMIIVFEGTAGAAGNNEAYAELNFVINKLLYDMRHLGVREPKVNLIGHGGGGLLNLMYAYNHPYNVDSIFSMGTPFNGSDIYTLLDELNSLGISFGSLSGGGADIIDQTVIQHNKNMWNSAYTVNPNMKAHAMAGAMSSNFIIKIMQTGLNMLDGLPDDMLKFAGIIEQINTKENVWEILGLLCEENNKVLISKYYPEIGNTLDAALITLSGLYPIYSLGAEVPDAQYLFGTGNEPAVLLSFIERSYGFDMAPLIDFVNQTLKRFIEDFDEYEVNDLFGNTDYVKDKLQSLKNDINKVRTELYNSYAGYLTAFRNIAVKASICPVISDIIIDGIAFFVDALPGIILSDSLLSSLSDILNGFETKNTTVFVNTSIWWEKVADFFTESELVFLNDFSVDFDSQLGVGYSGFQRYYKLFSPNNSNTDKMADWSFPIASAHNLETRDKDFIKYILEKISMSGTQYTTMFKYRNSGDGIIITGLNGNYDNSTSITVDEIIDGKTVIGIDEYAFSDGHNGISTKLIKKVILPDTVKTIGEYAFKGCVQLEKVTSATSNYQLPISLQKISAFAFQDCGVQEIDIHENISYIGRGAFAGCKTADFYVYDNNPNFSSANGSLYDKNKTALIKYSGNQTAFTCPASVKTIGEFAFMDSGIQSISLQNVERIEFSAFYNCLSLTQVNNAGNLIYSGLLAFSNTPWLDSAKDENGFVVLNNLIIAYRGGKYAVTENMFPANCTAIGAGAFAIFSGERYGEYGERYGEYIESIDIPGSITIIYEGAFSGNFLITAYIHENVREIHSNAFYGCPALEKVYMYPLYPPVHAYDAFTNNAVGRIIYIPGDSREYYEESYYYSQYKSSFDSYPVNISFNSNGGGVYGNIQIGYYSSILGLPLPQKTGYNFEGWFDEAGKKYLETSPCDKKSDFTLYAKWSPRQYKIIFDSDGGDRAGAKAVWYGTEIGELPVVSRPGYTFKGWYGSSDNFEYTATTIWDTAGDKTLIAKWTANTYTLSFDANGGAALNPAYKTVTYNSEVGILPEPQRAGYTFTGWYSNTDGTGTKYISTVFYFIAGNSTVYAQWQIIPYTISYTLNGGTNGNNPASYNFETATITLANPSKTGYTFGGWYENAQFTGSAVTSIPKGSTGNKTYYAKWTANTYTVTLDKNSADAVLAQTSVQVTYDAPFFLPVPARQGYSFEGWYSTPSGSGICYTSNSGTGSKNWDTISNITMYARWRTEVYTIKLSNGNITKYFNKDGISDALKTVTYGESFNLNAFINNILSTDFINDTLNFWFKKGHKIAGLMFSNGTSFGWTGSNVPDLGADQETINVYINWQKERHTILCYDGTMLKQTIIAYYDDAINVNTPAKTGYKLTRWYVSAGTVSVSDVQISNTFNFTFMPDCTPFLLSDGIIAITAEWTPKVSTVVFNSDGGSAVANVKISYNSSCSVFPSPSKAGYDFDGWYDSGNKKYNNAVSPSDPNIAVWDKDTEGEVTLKAKWTPKTYTVSYNANGGNTLNPGSKTVVFNTAVGTLPTPTRTGYSFLSWNSAVDGSGITYIASTAYIVSENSTLFAQWKINQYKILFDSKGGSAVAEKIQNYGSVVTAPASPIKDYYDFTLWYSDAALTQPYTFSTMPAFDITLFAKWTPKTYSITYILNGGTNSSNNPSAYTVESGKITLSNPSKLGYRFGSWTENNASGTVITAINSGSNGNKTLYANWIGTLRNYTGNGTYTMSDTVLFADISGMSTSVLYSKFFTISSSVSEVTFYSNNANTVFWNTSIYVENRNTTLIIRLCNTQLRGMAYRHVIGAANFTNTLSLECVGNNILTAGTAFDKKVVESSVTISPSALFCYNVVITGENLTLTGGTSIGQNTEGPDGISGGHGIYAKGTVDIRCAKLTAYGGDGQAFAPSNRPATPSQPTTPGKAGKGTQGTNGTTGYAGGKGYKGGDGGNGINCYSLIISSNSIVTCKGGNGGPGGQGGDGGKGGNGGEGGDGVFLGATAKKGGDGATGGRAGDGGNGGNAGKSVVTTAGITGSYKAEQSFGGAGGQPGTPGSGGAGGLGGEKTTGGRAETGNKGGSGGPGNPGNKGNDSN